MIVQWLTGVLMIFVIMIMGCSNSRPTDIKWWWYHGTARITTVGIVHWTTVAALYVIHILRYWINVILRRSTGHVTTFILLLRWRQQVSGPFVLATHSDTRAQLGKLSLRPNQSNNILFKGVKSGILCFDCDSSVLQCKIYLEKLWCCTGSHTTILNHSFAMESYTIWSRRSKYTQPYGLKYDILPHHGLSLCQCWPVMPQGQHCSVS